MATLLANKILTTVIAGLRTEVPAITSMATNFTAEELVLGQTATAHVPVLPTVSSWGEAAGYGTGTQSANSLLRDVNLTIDSHKFVTIDWDHITNISNDKNVFEEHLANASYVMGKAIVDSVLTKVTATNIPSAIVSAVGTGSADTLGNTRQKLNDQKAATRGRMMLIDSALAGELDSDASITQATGYDQRSGANGLLTLSNLKGFAQVTEYPDMPGGLRGFAFEPRAIALKTGLPRNTADLAAKMGIPAAGRWFPMQDPTTGLALMGIMWQQPGTFKCFFTVAALWGSAVGVEAGDGGVILANAGTRIVAA